MRCREVEALWDQIRDGMPSLRQSVHAHLRACPPCQDLYEEFEGVAYCLSCLPQPEPSCDLTKKVIEHIASIKHRYRSEPISLEVIRTAISLATSPAAWPPIPSATMKNPLTGSMYAESSLCSRTTPTSVTSQASSVTREASSWGAAAISRLELRKFSPAGCRAASAGAQMRLIVDVCRE